MWTAPPGDWLLTNGVYIPFQAPHVAQSAGLLLIPIVLLFLAGCWLWQDGTKRKAYHDQTRSERPV